MSGKTTIQLRESLRLDLKDTDFLWSDSEIDRAIEKSVSDLSRFLPRERVYEEVIDITVTDEVITSLATTSLTAIVNAQALNVSADSKLTIAGQPDKPRPLILTITDANSSLYGATFTVKGMDNDEFAQSETFHYSLGDSKTILGKKEFKTVYSVVVDMNSGAAALDVLSVGYGTTFTGWIYLANKPIDEDNISITSSPAGTNFTENTDYVVDCYNGRIKLLSTGSMIASTNYLVTYDKDSVMLDLSSIPDLISVNRVEYPVGDVPQSFISYDISEDNKRLTLGSNDEFAQVTTSDDKHIRVYYTAHHILPNEYSPGSIPEFLEDTVLMAAGAYALLQYALNCEHQSVTDLASARTNTELAITAQTALGTTLTNITKYLNNNTAADAAGILAAITAQAADLRTAIETALDAAAVHTSLTTATGASLTASAAATTAITNANVATWLTAVNTNLGLAITALGFVGNGSSTGSLDKTTTGAEGLLDTGIAKLLTVNLGGEQTNVPEGYASFARARAEIAGARVSQAIAYVQEASQRIAGVRSYIDQAEQNISIANSYATQANAIGSGLMIFIQEASQRLDNIRTYIQQAATYVDIANGFVAEAVQRNAVIQSYMELADRYFTASNQSMLLADKFKADATTRRDEVWTIWRDKRQYIGTASQVSNNQFNTSKST